ncbi:carboxypeptidase-like regulatory domain-containing protein [Gimesia sp.]|uniref:carboxypeptidase-like regulatory domain-containing protein n=1 Tax=Gimesia sp. TaxID=2024833 RepID=UPI000C3987B4|nr:carboxypeptidase-like regulatory domain-containing protein [Gimesia sp.]MAX37896.1 hypothetical protein [Gimesia sp.]HBL41919.1 hypothetical protein [Planctomycetaceae bacterium]|tara:strand:- start:12711 stop:13097 length:387 start_codon:yes stop_codon:yes gene_type:complete
MQHLRLFGSVVLCLGLAVGLSACGGSAAPALGKVKGKVTMDGAPLADANVTFMPENIRASSGTTDGEGNYELIYIRDEMGAAVGPHKVVISKLVDEKETIPPNYSDETELTADVKSGANEINFDLKEN